MLAVCRGHASLRIISGGTNLAPATFPACGLYHCWFSSVTIHRQERWQGCSSLSVPHDGRPPPHENYQVWLSRWEYRSHTSILGCERLASHTAGSIKVLMGTFPPFHVSACKDQHCRCKDSRSQTCFPQLQQPQRNTDVCKMCSAHWKHIKSLCSWNMKPKKVKLFFKFLIIFWMLKIERGERNPRITGALEVKQWLPSISDGWY